MSLHDYPIPSRSPDCYTDESINQTVDEIMLYMKKSGSESYLGDQEESISQLSHSLQAGHQAKLYVNQSINQKSDDQSINQHDKLDDQSINQCGGDDLILASFLHDLGHMILSRPDSWSNDESTNQSMLLEQHEYVGFAYLVRRGFSYDVSDLVLGHVQAKRYLVAVEPGYESSLSASSRQTLCGQGGKFSPQQARTFETSRNFQLKLAMRRWDEAAKDVNYQWQQEELEQYREMLKEHLQKQKQLHKQGKDSMNQLIN